jgi:hypothetical protein
LSTTVLEERKVWFDTVPKKSSKSSATVLEKNSIWSATMLEERKGWFDTVPEKSSK